MKKFLFITAAIFLLANVAYSQCEPISTFPWTEGFENNGTNLPPCWEEEVGSGWDWNWAVVPESVGIPATAHGGEYKAQISLGFFGLPVYWTRLITPVFDLSAVDEPVLNFWHTQTGPCHLAVYYKNSPNGGWTLLKSFFIGEVGNIPDWQEDRIMLPEKSDYYQIAFRGTFLGGGLADIQLDDISITGNEENPECPKAKNFNAIQEERNVVLNWIKPDEASCFMLFFNEEVLQGNITTTTFTHENVPEGVHTYKIINIAANCITDPVETTIQILSVTETEISKISIYPNPTTGVLNLIQEKIESRELKIENVVLYDVFGKVQKIENWKTESTIDISHLSAGVYFIKISTEAGEIVRKVLKE